MANMLCCAACMLCIEHASEYGHYTYYKGTCLCANCNYEYMKESHNCESFEGWLRKKFDKVRKEEGLE